MLLSTAVMAAALFDVSLLLQHVIQGPLSQTQNIGSLIILITTGLTAYFAASQLSGALRISELKAALKRK